MKEKQSKCSVEYISYNDPLSSNYIYRIYDIFFTLVQRYIQRRYFLRNIPIISLTDYKEKIEIYTKYLKKKSNLVGGKYLSLHRWISQRGSQLRRWSFNLRSGTRVLGGGFIAVKHLAKFRKWISFRSTFPSCEMGFGLQNFRNSFRSCEIFAQLDAVVFKRP